MKPNEPTLIENNKSPDCGMANGQCRQSGKLVIQDIIYRLRRRADNLQVLLDMLPSNPTQPQDEALWNVACGMERI